MDDGNPSLQRNRAWRMKYIVVIQTDGRHQQNAAMHLLTAVRQERHVLNASYRPKYVDMVLSNCMASSSARLPAAIIIIYCNVYMWYPVACS